MLKVRNCEWWKNSIALTKGSVLMFSNIRIYRVARNYRLIRLKNPLNSREFRFNRIDRSEYFQYSSEGPLGQPHFGKP